MASSKYVIDTVFNIIDGATKPLQKIGVGAANVGRQTEVMRKRVDGDVAAAKVKIAGAGAALVNMGKAAAGIATGAVVAGLAVATKQFIEFDNALHGAGAAFSDLSNMPIDEFNASLEEVGKAARAVAAATEFDAVQASNALTNLARAGVESKNAVALLPGIADLATAAAVTLDEAVGMAVGGLNTLGLMTDNPVELADNMKYMADIMAYTANSANMSLTDVSEAIKVGGVGFTKANQSIENMSAAITALASRGYVGAEAGNALKNMITKLSAPVPKAQASLDALGIVTQDSAGNLLNFVDIVGQFETATAGLGDAEIAAHLKNIFGLENINQFQAILGVGKEGLLQYTEAAANSAGASERMANVMRMSLSNQIEVLKSGLTELGFKFVEAFKTQGSEGLQTLITMIANFDPTALINFLVGAFDMIVKIAGVVGNLIEFLWSFKEIIIGLAAAWGIYEVAIIAVAVQQMIVDGVMKASSLDLIITVIGVLVGAIVWLIKHWDLVCEAMTKVWEVMKLVWASILEGISWIGEMAQQFGFLIGPMGYVISAIKEVANNWELVKAAFKDGGFLNGIKAIGLSLLSGVLAPIQSLLELLSNIPGLGHLAGLGAEKIGELRSNLQTSIEASAVAPVTNRDATMISREESVSTANVNIGLEKGLTGTVSGSAPGITVRTARSGQYSSVM